VRRAGVVVFDVTLGGCRRNQFDAALAHNLHLVLESGLQLERFAKQGLAAVVAINVGVVKGGDSHVQAQLDFFQRGLRRGVGAVGHAPCAINQGAESGQARVKFERGDQRRTPCPNGVAGAWVGTRPYTSGMEQVFK